MKTILVLTDFSDNATHAAHSAIMFGQRLGADILLLNDLASIPVTPNYIGGGFVAEEAGWLADESSKHIQELTAQLEKVISLPGHAKHKPEVRHLITEGDLGENIRAVSEQQQIGLIIMGGKTGGVFDHLFSGNDTKSVIENAGCPVLVIPPQGDFKKLKKVVFATDFNESDVEAVRYLAGLGKIFDLQLEIVHVSEFGKQELMDDQKELAFVSQVAKIKYPKIMYRDVRGKEVIARLHRLCEETGADMLALVHYPQSFFSRLLQTSHTEKALDRQELPLLVFRGEHQKQ